jgi:hypothetical protein
MKRILLLLTALALLLGGVGQARAEFIITFSQDGNDVKATGTGSLNLAGLVHTGTSPSGSVFVNPSEAFLSLGLASTIAVYEGSTLSGPRSFSTQDTGGESASFGTGLAFHIFGGNTPPSLSVDSSYTSGDSLMSGATWNNTTISGLHLKPGTYTYTWGTGANADDLKVVIPSATTSVPEPSTLTLLCIGSLGLLGYGWRRRKQAV